MEFETTCSECKKVTFLPMTRDGKQYCEKCAPPPSSTLVSMGTTGRHFGIVGEIAKSSQIDPCSMPSCNFKNMSNIRVVCSKCTYTYCLEHRFPQVHNCPFDFNYDLAHFWKLKYETGRAIIEPALWLVLCDIETGRGQLSESTQKCVIAAKEKLDNLNNKT